MIPVSVYWINILFLHLTGEDWTAGTFSGKEIDWENEKIGLNF